MESMAAIALAIAAGGALKGSKTTALMTGAQGVEAEERGRGGKDPSTRRIAKLTCRAHSSKKASARLFARAPFWRVSVANERARRAGSIHKVQGLRS
jgi:hypothetical protein